MPDLIITEAKFEEMDFLLSRAREEGWNPGYYDAVPFYQTDPHGFFIGTLGKEKIGCISAVAYDDAFGFIGFYIVLPNYRGQGFGHQLWAHGLNYLGDRTLGLDGVLKEQKSYEQSHFKLYYKNQRFERKDGGGRHSKELVNLQEVPFDVLLRYDEPIFGLERSRFLAHWIAMPNALALGKIKNGDLIGYGVLRSCYNGCKIGPLFADNTDVAIEIFNALCAKAGSASVFLDIPEINPDALEIAEAFHLTSNFETVRMYNKVPPSQQLDKIFGITSFELG